MAGFAGLIKLYETAVTEVYTVRYCALAATSLAVYEYVTTLDQEIELVWKSRWSWGKAFFFINRYYVLLFELIYYDYGVLSPHITDDFCLHWYRWAGGSTIATFVMAQSILQLRVYALYNRSKKVLALTMSVFLAAVTASATVMGTGLTKVTVQSHIIPGIPFCVPIGDSGVSWAVWIPILASDSLLCGLAVYKGFLVHRQQGNFRSPNRLVDFFLRDSVLYYIVIFAVYLVNTLIFIFAPQEIWGGSGVFAVVVASSLVNRLIFNVREMLKRNASPAGSVTSQASSVPSSLPIPLPSSLKALPMRPGTSVSTNAHVEERVLDMGNHQTGSELDQYELKDIERGRTD